jgi:adenylate cyclase 10
MVTTVQKYVYRHEGSINKLLMDDKGSTLICLWGLTPMAHEDDAARAITCAYSMRKAILEECGAWTCFGISSGEVFSGIAGTIGSRKEYTSLGDVVNVSARIMAWPMYKGIKGKIFVENNTKT